MSYEEYLQRKDKSIQLSKYFNEWEFIHSKSNLKYYKLDNRMDCNQKVNASNLCVNYLDGIRSFIGHPVYISSGYRCHDLNKAIGGHPNSYHTQGLAADILCPSLSLQKLASTIVHLISKKLIYYPDQLIYYPHQGFIHFGIRENRFMHRRQVFEYTRDGEYKLIKEWAGRNTNV